LNAASALNSQFNNNNNSSGGGSSQSDPLAGIAGNLLSVAAGNNNSNNQNNNSNNGNNAGGGSGIDLSSIGSLLGMIPQAEEKKATLIDYITPLVKAMSPKWGDVIVGILRNLDLEKLLAATKDEKELEKTVRKEEARLEKGN